MHKKYILPLLGLLGCLPIFAAPNNISMVSYFPVPYALYERVYVTTQMDLGLNRDCLLKVGRGRNVALQVDNLNLNGRLSLLNVTTFSSSGTVSIGGNITDKVGLLFGRDLQINSPLGGSTNSLESFNTNNLYLTNGNETFYLFNSTVVSNNKNWIKDCTEGAHWEKLRGADGKDYIYLVCGTTGEAETCTPSRKRQSGIPGLKDDTCDGDIANRFNGPVAADKTCMDVYSLDPSSFGTMSQCTKTCIGSSMDCNECSSASDCTSLDPSASWKCACYGNRMTCIASLPDNLGLLQASNGNYYKDPNASTGLVFNSQKDEVKICAGSGTTATQTTKKCLTYMDSCIHTATKKEGSGGGISAIGGLGMGICNNEGDINLNRKLNPDATLQSQLANFVAEKPNTCSFGSECSDCDTSTLYYSGNWNGARYAFVSSTAPDLFVQEPGSGNGNFDSIDHLAGQDCITIPVARCIEVPATESCKTPITGCTKWSDGIEKYERTILN